MLPYFLCVLINLFENGEELFDLPHIIIIIQADTDGSLSQLLRNTHGNQSTRRFTSLGRAGGGCRNVNLVVFKGMDNDFTTDIFNPESDNAGHKVIYSRKTVTSSYLPNSSTRICFMATSRFWLSVTLSKVKRSALACSNPSHIFSCRAFVTFLSSPCQ